MSQDDVQPQGPIAYRCTPSRCVRILRAGETPAAGAHLVTPFLGFAHHGIHVGEGRVIHYGALVYDLIRRPVEEVSLEEFAGGRPVFVVTHAEGAVDAADVVRRARSRLGEARYRLLSNNCEHFVEWCLHGEHRSFQVERALGYPRRVGEAVQGFLVRLIAALLPGGTRVCKARRV
jgi:hypothetical protein